MECLFDFVNRKKSMIPDGIDWAELWTLARRQEMEGIVSYQIRDGLSRCDIPAYLKTKLFKAYADTCFKYEKRLKLLKELDEGFQQEKIPYIVVKGTEIARLYPQAKLRTMGDSDILVHLKDKSRVRDLLLKLGWEQVGVLRNEWNFLKEGLELELHHKLEYSGLSNFQKQKAFQDRVWDYASCEKNSVCYHLDWSYHFVFVITHLRKHFINCSVGFRQFMDIAVIAQSCELHWEWIKKELSSMGLLGFAKICFGFCNEWFGTQFPFDDIRPGEEFAVDATKHILQDGLYSLDNLQNYCNGTVFENRMKGSKEYRLFSIRHTLEMIFPSYHELRLISYYTFIDGKPWLMPAAWLYRLGRYLFGMKVGDFSRESDTPQISSQAEAKRNEEFDRWKIND